MQLSYWLFREKAWNPRKFFEMTWGERQIVRAFFLKEVEEIEEAYKKLED